MWYMDHYIYKFILIMVNIIQEGPSPRPDPIRIMVSMNWKYCISYFFTSVANPRIYVVGLKLLNLKEVLLLGIIFYMICADGSDIDGQKFR